MNLALPPTILMKNTCGLETYGYLKPEAGHIWYIQMRICIWYIYSDELHLQKSELKAICIFQVYGNFERLPLNIFIRILFDLR